MMPLTGTDNCATIEVETAYYEAAVVYDRTQISLANGELSGDETWLNYWMYQGYKNGCSAMASQDQQEVTRPTQKSLDEATARQIMDEAANHYRATFGKYPDGYQEKK